MQPGENVRKTEVGIIIPKIPSSVSKVEVEESSLPASFLGGPHAGVCKCMVRTIKTNAWYSRALHGFFRLQSKAQKRGNALLLKMSPRQLPEAENCGLMRRESGETGVCYNPEDDKHNDLGLGRGKLW